MRKTVIHTIAALSLALASSATAQVIVGESSGSQYTTSTWTNGAASSFGGWFFSSGAGALNNISDSAQNGRTSIGSESFFILGGTSGSYFDAFAPLGGSLSNGQSISVNANYSWNGGIRGIEFEEAFGTGPLFGFEHGGSDALRFVVGGVSAEVLANAYNQAFTYTVAHSGPSSVTVTAALFGSPSPFFSTNLTLAAMPNQVKFYTGGYSGGADQSNYGLYFNNVTTIPEPQTWVLTLASALLLLALRLRLRPPKSTRTVSPSPAARLACGCSEK